jgi:hypothetical protein
MITSELPPEAGGALGRRFEIPLTLLAPACSECADATLSCDRFESAVPELRPPPRKSEPWRIIGGTVRVVIVAPALVAIGP